MEELLMIPGPVAVSADVLAACATPMQNHRGPLAKKLYGHLNEQLREILRTKQDVLLLGASGTGALEAIVVNLFSAGDRLLALSAGVFGERIVNIARAYGADVEVLDTQWGDRNDPGALRERLARDTSGEIKGILVTHNETSTGVTNDLKAIAKAKGDHPALLVVDSVSAAGAVEAEMDLWGLDAVATASQKALACVPGAAMVALSERGWRAAESAKMPRFYFDLRVARSSFEASQTPWTPPLPVLLALERAADNYLKEGQQSAFARHARYASAVRAGCAALGLSLFARPSAFSPTVTAVDAPKGVEVKALLARLREQYGVVFAGGQKRLEGKIFRIGNMGALAEKDIGRALDALEHALRDFGVSVLPGEARSAAMRELVDRAAPQARAQAV